MHYIPQSTTEMLRGETTCNTGARESFHYLSAPLYLLTAVVAGLLLADWVLLSGRPAADSMISGGPTLLGYRLALLAAVLGGARILYQTLDSLLSGRIGADLALTIACLAAIALGEHQTAALVVLIALVGECIEGYTIDRARSALRDTFALWPLLAHRIQNGHETDVRVEELSAGDVVIIRPGERIPVDGHVVGGTSAVDQSSFTGESVPVEKAVGTTVFAGTLNQFGALTVVADSTGDQTALARMAQAVGTGMTRKTSLERTADDLAKWFLPVVLSIAALTLVGWRISTGNWRDGYLPALAVLVVACPCPLVLATPCAVMASLAWLARRGVVIKGSAVLERLATVDMIAFDKTGTLTQGALAVGEIIPLTGWSSNAVLQAAAIAEKTSEHLLGRLVTRAAQDLGLTIPFPTDFKSVAGAGVMAKIPADELFAKVDRGASADKGLDQQTRDTQRMASIVVGNRRVLDQSQIAFSHDVAIILKERESLGESPLVIAVDGSVIGVITVRETIRNESRDVLDELRSIGVTRFALLTGDRHQPTEAVVKSLGMFETVATEQLPVDKAAWVDQAQKSGRKVAMVGDGVNDAPALAAADVGIALGRAGGDLAGAAGEIVLLGDPLRPLPGLVRLSRALVQNIWQSILLFAFGLNGLGIMACSLRWLDPIGGAVFHEVASLAVMCNAMRLLWFDGWSSPVATRWIETSLSIADWVALNASPTKWVYWFLERWQLAAKLGFAMLFGGWCLSGIILLTADEQAVVTRFGRYQTTLSAGVYWRWPYPFDRVIRRQVGRVRSVAIGYRDRLEDSTATSQSVFGGLARNPLQTTPAAGSGSKARSAKTTQLLSQATIEWTSTHDDRERSGLGNDSMMLTSDEVPIELMSEVQYRIGDLREFVFAGAQQPNEILRATAESVLREVAATASLDSLLTDSRAALERRSLEMLRNRIKNYAVGIEVVDLQWLDVHPPQAVVPAYRQAADALEEKELLINEAQAYASRTLLAAIGADALSHLQQAAREQTPNGAHSPSDINWTMTDDLWRQLREAGTDGNSLLSGSAAAAIADGELSRTQREFSSRGIAQRFEKLLTEYKSEPKLTRDYLYWKAMMEVLSSRPVTIIDPKAVGRQQLWLTEPVPGALMPVPFMGRGEAGNKSVTE